MGAWLIAGSLETITRLLCSFTVCHRTANPAYGGGMSWLHNTANTVILHTSVLLVDVLIGDNMNVTDVFLWNALRNREASVLFSPSSEFRVSFVGCSVILFGTTSIASERGKVSFALPSFAFLSLPFLFLFRVSIMFVRSPWPCKLHSLYASIL